MGQCVLPVSKPYITHTPVIANMLSILQTNPNTESWIANHFVNIFINKDRIFDNFYDRNMFFYGCPWLQVNQIRREVVLRICHRITDYVKALLSEGFYVYATGNTEHIPAYHSEHYWAHNLFIYGYDDELQLFYISDFFINGKYERAICSYDELEMALQTSNMNRHFVNLIYGIKLKEIDYVFELDWLNEMLNEHLNSENLFCKYRTRQDEEYYSNKEGNKYYHFSFSEIETKYYFGISYYDKITEMILDNSSKLMRPLDLIYEHKVMMSKRVEFLYQNGYLDVEDYLSLSEECKRLSDKTIVLRNLWIKYRMSMANTNSSGLLKRVYNHILESKNLDIEFTKRLISCISC